MKEIILLVGPAGSGKSTYAKQFEKSHIIISQDSMGKEGHLSFFKEALSANKDIIIDRMSFNKDIL